MERARQWSDVETAIRSLSVLSLVLAADLLLVLAPYWAFIFLVHLLKP